MFPLLDEAISPDLAINDSVTYVTSVGLFHGANLDAEQIESLKQNIQDLIDCPMTRRNGLLLFEAALQQITPFYIDRWPNIITANLTGIDILCKEIAFRILKLILRKTQNASYKTTVQFTVPSFTKILVAEENLNCLAAVECLSLCIKAGPNQLACLKADIEMFLLKQMDTSSIKMCEALSECFVGLLCVEEYIAGRHLTFNDIYKSFQKKILYTLQEIVKRLLCSSEDFPIESNEENDDKETFELPDTSDIQFSTSLTLARIFSTLCICASKMLSSEIIEESEVNVPVLWILEFMNRVFEMTHLLQDTQSNMSNELLLIIYPIIHKSVFIMVESLIQHFDLIEQVENIIHLIRRSVEASYISTFSNKCNSQMRYATWKMLNIWLNKCGLPVSLIIGNKKYIIVELLKDTVCETPEDQSLMIALRQTSSKKKTQDIFFPDPAEKSNYSKSKMRTCNEALKALRLIIYTASPFLEDKLKDEITSTVISTSKKIQKYNHFKIYPFPYMDEECRCNLYELNMSFLMSWNSFKIQVLTQCVAILKLSCRDQSLKIKEFSHRATSMSRHVLHSRKKSPEAFTFKKTLLEPIVEDNLYLGWENQTNWIVNNSDNTNISSTNGSQKSNKHMNLPQEAHKNENERNSSSNKEFDSASYGKEEIHCNGDTITGVNPSSQSESEMEDQCEQDSPTKQLIDTVHSSKSEDKESTSEPDMSSEEDNLSIADKENDSKVEDDINSGTCNEAILQTDQNGLYTTSEEEIPSSYKRENRGYSTDEGSYEEEEKDDMDNKHESELSDNEPPFKKQKTFEVGETIEEINESKPAGIKHAISEFEIARESSEDGDQMPNSPTVEDMCKTFVLCEPTSELAES